MKKLFRMAYESCSGSCYAYSDVMKIHTLGLDAAGAAEFLKRLAAMHAPSCGNINIQFRLDHDEKLNVFVASMYRYGSLDLFASETPLGAMNDMIDAALAWYETDEAKKLMTYDPGKRADVCHHGTDEKLFNFAIEFSGLDEKGRGELREQLETLIGHA